ncbi:MAG: hypothetical protein EBQ94_03545 [Flavobacteriales bacterium]|nr:hypothetical protein [Flavobacteriales bacterium]NCA19923.1 hypothetical protein [Crocinitomicaceae bacterium]
MLAKSSFIFLSSFFIFAFSSKAQMINNFEGKAFTDAPYFNVDFIKANKIKSITGHYSRKKDGGMIRETSDFYQYNSIPWGNLFQLLEQNRKTIELIQLSIITNTRLLEN